MACCLRGLTSGWRIALRSTPKALALTGNRPVCLLQRFRPSVLSPISPHSSRFTSRTLAFIIIIISQWYMILHADLKRQPIEETLRSAVGVCAAWTMKVTNENSCYASGTRWASMAAVADVAYSRHHVKLCLASYKNAVNFARHPRWKIFLRDECKWSSITTLLSSLDTNNGIWVSTQVVSPPDDEEVLREVWCEWISWIRVAEIHVQLHTPNLTQYSFVLFPAHIKWG